MRLEDGQKFGPLRAIATPGHAADHLAYIAGSACFSGDAVLGEGSVFVYPDPGALRGYLSALRRLRVMGLRVICPGHGPVVLDAAAKLDEYIAHRLERERRLVDGARRRPAHGRRPARPRVERRCPPRCARRPPSRWPPIWTSSTRRAGCRRASSARSSRCSASLSGAPARRSVSWGKRMPSSSTRSAIAAATSATSAARVSAAQGAQRSGERRRGGLPAHELLRRRIARARHHDPHADVMEAGAGDELAQLGGVPVGERRAHHRPGLGPRVTREGVGQRAPAGVVDDRAHDAERQPPAGREHAVHLGSAAPRRGKNCSPCWQRTRSNASSASGSASASPWRQSIAARLRARDVEHPVVEIDARDAAALADRPRRETGDDAGAAGHVEHALAVARRRQRDELLGQRARPAGHRVALVGLGARRFELPPLAVRWSS